MAYDRLVVLAELDRFIESLEDAVHAKIGQDLAGLDIDLATFSGGKPLSNHAVVQIVQFGQRNERRPAGEMVSDELDERQSQMAARVESSKNTVQTVQIVQNAELASNSNHSRLDKPLIAGAECCPNCPISDALINCPLRDVPPRRWTRFIADADTFRASGFAEQAKALGWTDGDLFGCGPVRPVGSIDPAGLVWLLDSDRIVALTADMAVIESQPRARYVYRRR